MACLLVLASLHVEAKPSKIAGVFRQGMLGQVGLLDPVKSINAAERRVLENMQETLLSIDPATGNLQPQAAESYTLSDDGRELVFTLRARLFFSNGEPVTAQDYAFALRRHLQPKNQSAYMDYVSQIQGAKELMEGMFYHPEKIGIKASVVKGKQTLSITLVQAFPKMLSFFAHVASSPIHQQSYQRQGDKYFILGNMHASGAFIGVRKSAKLLLFAPNPHYSSVKQIALKQVQLYLYDTGEQAEQAFLQGKIDQYGTRMHPVSDVTMRLLKGSDVLFFQPDLRTLFVRFHTRRVPTSEYAIRQALSMAIDRSEIEKLALTAKESPSFAMTPDQQHLYDPPHTYYYSVQSAKDLLQKSGFCMQENQQQCIELPHLEMIFPKTLLAQKIVVLLKEQWGKLGFKHIGLEGKSEKDFLAQVNDGLFMIALDEIAVDTFDFFDLLHAFDSTQPTAVGAGSKYFDDLVRAATKAHSLSVAITKYREAESLLLRDAAVVPLVQTTTTIVKALHVKGYKLNVWDVHPWKDLSIQ